MWILHTINNPMNCLDCLIAVSAFYRQEQKNLYYVVQNCPGRVEPWNNLLGKSFKGKRN